jgi:putative sterol carrier protein
MASLLERITEAVAAALGRLPPRARGLLVWGPFGRITTAMIFAAMRRRFRPSNAGSMDVVARWDVGGDEARYVAVRQQRCHLARQADREPDLTLALDRITLLELAIGAANAPQLFMSGRLRLTGDLMLAQRLTAVFAVPGSK